MSFWVGVGPEEGTRGRVVTPSDYRDVLTLRPGLLWARVGGTRVSGSFVVVRLSKMIL